jgi:REP element-mobilizing transposase RayT
VVDEYPCGMAHPPRIPVWLPLDQEVVYFITFCVEDRMPVLATPSSFDALNTAVSKLRDWWVVAAVMMPDHIHLLAAPKERDLDVGNLSASLKRWIRQSMQADWQWQPGSFDRLLRSNESAAEKWEYMRQNPVRAGLVIDWQEWPYSIGFHDPRDPSL